METKVSTFSSIIEANKQKLNEIEQYRKAPISTKARNLAFGGLTIGTGVLFILFASQIITGMLALLLSLGVGVGGFFSLRFIKEMDPLIQQKTRNNRLKWMMNEARKHAIYQLDNQVLANKDRLTKARQARDKMKALILKMEGKINPANEGTPMYKRKTEALATVKDAYALMEANLEKGVQANQAFKQKVLEYKDMDTFATIAAEAMSLLGSSGSKDLEEMLSLTSFDSIETNFHEALVSIENSARDMALDEA